MSACPFLLSPSGVNLLFYNDHSFSNDKIKRANLPDLDISIRGAPVEPCHSFFNVANFSHVYTFLVILQDIIW